MAYLTCLSFLSEVRTMVVTLEEIKNYLRVDFDEDDGLLLSLLSTSERMCMDILRTDERDTLQNTEMPGQL